MFGLDNSLFLVVSCLHLINGWSYKCEYGFCTRTTNVDDDVYPSLEVCNLICASFSNLWPHPTGKLTAVKNLVKVDPRQIYFKINGAEGVSSFLKEVIDYFTEKLEHDGTFSCQENSYPVTIYLAPLSEDLALNLNTNESYSLELEFTDEKISIHVDAATVYGVRHGLETLLQLLVPYESNKEACLVTLSYVHINDKPVYAHRGLLLDTARNYLSLSTIKRHIDGMAASKLNVLHWHITDSQSFPFESVRLPNMTKYGAYSLKQIYTASDIKGLVHYAKVRGVRVLMEIDGPSHAGNGWQWGKDAGLGTLAICVNEQPWRSLCIQPPCGQLNPANPHLYQVLGELYKDIHEATLDNGMFHMGGDEVYIPCWNSSKFILDYLKDKPLTNYTFFDLWGEYQRKALEAYDLAVGHSDTFVVVWTSHLTQPEIIQKYLPKERYIIQTWVPEASNELLTALLKLGYRLIISTKDRWYLDHGFWGTTKYYNWQTVYENPLYKFKAESILGGEVCMWGELVDDHNIDSRVWPRAAAAGERLWSNPRLSAETAKPRFFSQRERLIKIGINAEAVTVSWCLQNQGQCVQYLL